MLQSQVEIGMEIHIWLKELLLCQRVSTLIHESKFGVKVKFQYWFEEFLSCQRLKLELSFQIDFGVKVKSKLSLLFDSGIKMKSEWTFLIDSEVKGWRWSQISLMTLDLK